MSSRLGQHAVPATTPAQRPSSDRRTPALRAIILLAGSVRPGELSRGIDRSLLDLPVEPGRSVLAHWQAAAAELANSAGVASLPVRVVVDQTRKAPSAVQSGPSTPLSIEREHAELRGTGGLLRDLARGYAPSDLLLVGNGAQILVEPLTELTGDLLAADAPVAILAHEDGTPSGLFLVRCSIFDSVAEIGFLDFKEQLLPRLAASGVPIRVIRRTHAAGFPVRTLDGYLSGLSALHRQRAGEPILRNPFSEQWGATFSIIEPGATVAPGAIVHDSVVLSGAALQRGSAVVRCVVCPGAIVRSGRTLADQVVTPEHRSTP